MRKRSSGAWIAAAITAALHLLALLQFSARHASLDLPPDWTRDFQLLLGASVVLAAIMHVAGSRRARLAAGVARLVIFVLAGLPFGGFLDIRFLLLFSLLLDANVRIDPPGNLAISAAALAASAVFLVPLNAFSVSLPAPRLLDGAVYLAIGTGVAFLLGLLRRTIDRERQTAERVSSLNDIVAKLMSTSRDYLEYAARVQRESTERERARITQDLHDVVGQAFTNIYAMMDASLKHPPAGDAEVRELHAWAKEQSQKGLNETRAILYQLRSIREREPSGIPAIKNLVDTFTYATRVKVRVEWGNLPWDIGGELDEVLYRVVQESLVNAFRHGNATEIQIHFWVGDAELSLDIQDDGSGSAAAKKGIGQESMENRVALAGGRIAFASTGQGYNVHATFPRRLAGEGGPAA